MTLRIGQEGITLNSPQLPVTQISSTLLEWYERQARSLPWRKSPSPYAVLVSEIMLQQTQVATVIPYFERWMKRFPDLSSLAEASEKEVLKYWEGLGYYRRARSLLKLAREIQQDRNGDLPREEAALLALPGIGPYTAGAILSIAFNRPFPAVDGNVERVLTRLFDLGFPVDRAPGKRRIRELALGLIPEGQARSFNQAIMELGATICLPRPSLCDVCPLNFACQGRREGTLSDRPVKSPGAMTLPLLAGSVVIERKGLFLVFKRPPTGLMADLWEFPTLHFARLPDPFQIREGLRLSFGLNAGNIQKLFTVHHSFTRYRATIRAFIAREPTGTPHVPKGWEKRWVTPEEILTLTFSAGSRKIRDRTMTLFPEDIEDIGSSR